MEKVKKPYQLIVLLLTIVNFILCFISFGRKEWFILKTYKYLNTVYLDLDSWYDAKFVDFGAIGIIFFILCCIVILFGIILLSLRYIKKREINIINIIFSIVSLVTGIFGIIAQALGKKYISEDLIGHEVVGCFDYEQTYFTNEYVLYIVLSTSILIITYSVIELIISYLLNKKLR